MSQVVIYVWASRKGLMQGVNEDPTPGGPKIFSKLKLTLQYRVLVSSSNRSVKSVTSTYRN